MSKDSSATLGRIISFFRTIFPPLKEWRAAGPAFGLAAISGLILMLANRPANLSILTLVALVPLFWGLRRCKPVMAFYVSLVFGVLHAIPYTYWLASVARFNPFVYAGLPPLWIWWGAHLAVGFAVIVYFARNLTPTLALMAAMMAWVGLEYFRMVGALGIPYGLLGHSLGGWPSMAQNASLLGIPFLSALIIAVNLCIMETIAAFRAGYGQFGAVARLGTMLALVVAGHINGSRIIADTEARFSGPDSFTMRIALVQTNIDQEVKFASYASDDPIERQQLQDEIMTALITQLESVEPESVDLILTPESSLTGDFIDVEAFFQMDFNGGVPLLEIARIATDLNIPIVVGGVDYVFRAEDGADTDLIFAGLTADPQTGNMVLREGYRVYGAFWIVRPGELEVRPIADYRKVKLMPFGETVPYFDLIPGFSDGVVGIGSFASAPMSPPIGIMTISRGEEEAREVRLGPSICFEDLFPNLHRNYTRFAVQLFINMTNNAWFDGSSGPHWHMEGARWRSIEFRTPMVRATNTGLTVVIDATGRVVDRLPLMEKDILIAEVAVVSEPIRTLYSRLGYGPALLCFLGTIGLWGWLLLFRRDP